MSRRRGRKRQVRIDVPAGTCTRGEGGIGWVEQYGPISASQVLALLPTAELRRGLVDPDTGRLLTLDPPDAIPDLSEALEQAREHLAAERAMQQQWTRESFQREHQWDGRTERRATPRPPRSREDVAAEAEQIELLLRWREQQRPPERDPDTLSDLDRQLLALTLADRALPPDDPSRRVEPQHDPSPALAELVRQRDDTCDGPGCTMPTRSSDLDHHHRYDPTGPTHETPTGETATGGPTGGPNDETTGEAGGGTAGPSVLGGTRTSAASLIPRSERCHQAKHHPTWTAVSHRDGSSTWTSPTGNRYLTRSSLTPLLPRPKPWRPTTEPEWQGPPAAYDDQPLIDDELEQ